jgi:carbonic anhydrase
MNKNKSTWQNDLPASLVVFLVALPLCLGVGLASTNVPSVSGLPSVFSGLIAGVIGGIVVGFFSKSKIGVSGPAAGLITIVIAAITTLGSFEAFLVAVVFAGILQIAAGFLKLGILANYFPSSVIKGMLAAIGITLLLKEFPHAIGYDKDFFGDESFFQNDGHNTFSELLYAMNALHPGSIIISCVSIVLLLLFERPFLKKIVVFKFLPSALFVVVIGVLLNMFFAQFNARFAIQPEHLVQLPVVKSISEVTSLLVFPDFSFLSNPNVYIIGATIALVGSLETLLSVEATDKLDPMKNHTPTNRELKAQGIGNIVSGLLGGLPITQVVVRSSANINAGAS